MTSEPSSKIVAARVAGLACAGVGVSWYVALMRPLWAAAALSPICGHSGLFAVHCPSCYAAAALVVAGLTVAAAAPARLASSRVDKAESARPTRR
jgi:hypothetical protein